MSNLRKDKIFKHIVNGNLEYVKKWVKTYPNDINYKDEYNNGNTPLHRACKYGNLEIVKYLIDNGADIHNKTNHGWTSLHYACEFGHIEIAKYLVEKGADVNYNDDYTPLHRACLNGYLEIAKYLIDKGADINIKNNDGNTPLDYLTNKNRQLITQFI